MLFNMIIQMKILLIYDCIIFKIYYIFDFEYLLYKIFKIIIKNKKNQIDLYLIDWFN